MLSINECIDILDVTINNYERLAQSSEAWQTLKTAVLAQQTTNSVRDAIWVVRAIATRCGYMEDSEFLRCLDALPKQHP